MASDTGSCAGSVIRSDKSSSEQEVSSERRITFTRPSTLRPIVTCSSSSSSFSSSSSAAAATCSVFRASKSVENSSNSDNISHVFAEEEVEICTTPKAKEYRIPEILQCPPAPRKRRVRSRFHSVPLRGFFVPPDLDSMFSMHKIPVNI